MRRNVCLKCLTNILYEVFHRNKYLREMNACPVMFSYPAETLEERGQKGKKKSMLTLYAFALDICRYT